jgi:hypothetical protein
MMLVTIDARKRLRKRRTPSPIEAERARVRALPAIRMLADRFAMPTATAILTAEAFDLHTGRDR